MRIDWTELPEAVTKEVADRAGGAHITPATTGDHAEIAATVTGMNGKVFVKAAIPISVSGHCASSCG